MKLITEYTNDSIQYKTDSEKKVYIEGVFMQAEKKNRNGRIYPKNIMERAVRSYIQDSVQTGRAVGELNHPDTPTINLDKVSHRIIELNWNGNDIYGKALVLNTPMGLIVKGLVEGGVKLGVSSRGMGSLYEKGGQTYVSDDFVLTTIDVVQDPSAPSAFVNGIMEGVSWIWENGMFKPQAIEKAETEIRKTSSKNLKQIQEKVFRDLLSNVKL